MIQKLQYSDKDKEQLSQLAVDPATQADDLLDYSRVVIKKPWGYEYLIFQNNHAAVWFLSISYGTKTSLHCHPNKKTGLVLLSGKARVTSLNESHEINAGHGFVIDKGTFHSTEAMSREGIMIMEVETPVNKKDLVRFSDAYGRSGKGYEGKDHHVLLDGTHHHFHKEEDRYHRQKKFGDCVLMVAQCRNEKELQDVLFRTDADIVSVLGGNLHTTARQCIGEVGDTMNAHELRTRDDLLLPEEVEILIIKKEA